jgi:transketolase
MFTNNETPFEIGKANILTDGDDVAIVACGILVWQAILASEKLYEKHGINARVINMHTIKPIDVNAIVQAALECGCIVTAEEHQVHGGLGGAVAEVTAKNIPVPIEFVGVKDTFGGSGEPEELCEIFGLTWKEIYASALTAIERKNNTFQQIRFVKDVPKYDDSL